MRPFLARKKLMIASDLEVRASLATFSFRFLKSLFFGPVCPLSVPRSFSISLLLHGVRLSFSGEERRARRTGLPGCSPLLLSRPTPSFFFLAPRDLSCFLPGWAQETPRCPKPQFLASRRFCFFPHAGSLPLPPSSFWFTARLLRREFFRVTL